MKTKSLPARGRLAGFTLVEVMISMAVVTLVLSAALGTFLFCLRVMYKDNMRLVTNASLRYFMAQVSKETLDASEFYIFQDYSKLDGNVDLNTATSAGLATAVPDAYGTQIYHGDCLVLASRTSLDTGATIRQFKIYYRTCTDPNDYHADGQPNGEGALRYWVSKDYGTAGSGETDLTPLLNKVVLKGTYEADPAKGVAANPYPGSQVMAARARGRPKAVQSDPAVTACYPIFSSEYPTLTPNNENVSINVEIINGVSANNLLSSSSFNYTISPRR